MKTNLFVAALGCFLLGAILISATDKSAARRVNQKPVLEQLNSPAPVPEKKVAASPKLPVPFYLSLIAAISNGTSIDMNRMNPEGQSSIWNEVKKWDREN